MKPMGWHYDEGVETVWINGATGRRMIHGVASTPTITSRNHSRASKGVYAQLPVPLFSQHAQNNRREKAIGQVVLLRKSDQQIYVRAVLHENNLAADHAWGLIVSGEVRAFSVAAANDERLHLQGEVDGIKFYDRWTLSEVSICRRGANPDCYFEIFTEDLARGGRDWPLAEAFKRGAGPSVPPHRMGLSHG